MTTTYLILFMIFLQLWHTLPVLPPLDFFKFSVPFLKSLEKNGKPRCGYRCQQQGDCPGKFLIRKKSKFKSVYIYWVLCLYFCLLPVHRMRHPPRPWGKPPRLWRTRPTPLATSLVRYTLTWIPLQIQVNNDFVLYYISRNFCFHTQKRI